MPIRFTDASPASHPELEPLLEQAACRIRLWSRQEQLLAGTLATLRGLDDALGALQCRSPEEAPTDKRGLNSLTGELADPYPRVEAHWDPASLDSGDPIVGSEWESMTTRPADWVPVRQEPAEIPKVEFTRRVGPFDELFTAVSDPSADSLRPTGPLPSLTRFRVRVAPVTKSTRVTKRNYDYFEELNSALAERANRSASREVGPGEQLTH